ncbi:F-box protein At2g26160 [Coffea arabica]|uniref:F-box protein At2g26160 n=1 Tax=Coffea arabica TaxID=13443 RepID=A0A6P6U285_COFAR
MVDWSSLPVELLGLIARQLRFAQDYVRFGAVCKSWRRVILQRDGTLCSLLPLLMLAEKEFSDLREFCCPLTDRMLKLYLPEIRGKRCWGSSDGWLVTIGADFQMCLLNPLTRKQILLPPLHKCSNLNTLICSPEEFRDYFVCKVVLTSSPASSSCVILAIYSDFAKMALAKLGDESWTPLQSSSCLFLDVIYFGGQLYAIDSLGNIMIYSICGSCIETIPSNLIQSEDELEDRLLYLVDIGGQVHVVQRYVSEILTTQTPERKTWKFEIYKLEAVSHKLEEINCLGDWSIFVGNNHSFAVSTSDHPECCSNCIYFTDDYSGISDPISHGYDVGIYIFENHKIQPFIGEDVSPARFSVPLWFRPVLV